VNNSDGQLHPLAALADSGAQEQRPQMLFYGAETDVERARDFLLLQPSTRKFKTC